MRSALPKVLHPIQGKPMVWYAIDTAVKVTGKPPYVVIGHGGEQVINRLGKSAHYVRQDEQLGTGHAVQQVEPHLKTKSDLVLVTYADMPLLTTSTLSDLVSTQGAHEGPITMLTVEVDDPRGFGRIVRDPDGNVTAIVEEAQASPDQLNIRELNAGVYCFYADWLWSALSKISISPKGEYYLTDLVEIASSEGRSVKAVTVHDETELIGINTRVHLAEATEIIRTRINQRLMLEGVTFIDPATAYIDTGIEIGRDSIIFPNSFLKGNTAVGEACTIGPNSYIESSRIGNHCKVFASVIEDAVLEDDVDIGPFGHLRKGAHLAKGVHMGNFGEVKDSYLGPGTKMGHFSYIGNATIGENVNIGAGSITCNYDGKKKNQTEIGDDVFIGSDTMLVAPIKLDDRSRTGAGSVVTKDVDEDTLVVGMPARAIRKKKPKDK